VLGFDVDTFGRAEDEVELIDLNKQTSSQSKLRDEERGRGGVRIYVRDIAQTPRQSVEKAAHQRSVQVPILSPQPYSNKNAYSETPE
jgi:hypothetical protein